MSDEQRNGGSGSNGRARNVADILREAGVTSTASGGRRRRRDQTPDPIDEFGTVESAGSFGSDFGNNDFTGRDPSSSDLSSSELLNEFGSGGFSSDFSSGEFRSLSAYLLAPESSSIATPAPDLRPRDSAPQAVRPPEPRRPDVGPPEPGRPDVKPRETRPVKPAAASPTMASKASTKEVPRTDTGPVTPFGWAARDADTATSLAADSNPSAASTSVAGRARKSTAPAEEFAGPRRKGVGAGTPQVTAAGTAGSSHANRSRSPLASSPPEDSEDTEAAVPLRTGAGSWAILAVELLAALGLGVAAWYAFSALWELLPYVAAFTGPLVVTGLVAVAGALRARTGRNPLGLPTLCILVLAGMVLVVLPAATVIIP